MHMFNADRKLHKYNTVEEIIGEFYDIRMKTYAERKAKMVEELQYRLKKMTNRAKYILENLNGEVDLRRKTAQQVADLLNARKYDKIDDGYQYLTKMPMDSVTQENVANIMKEKENTETELAALKATSLEKLWTNELDVLDAEYDKYKKHREQIQAGSGVNEKPKKAVKSKK